MELPIITNIGNARPHFPQDLENNFSGMEPTYEDKTKWRLAMEMEET
jgi:hypothetical protein